MASEIRTITADGEVDGVNAPTLVHSVILTPAAAVATLSLKTGGASGTVLCTLQAAANGASATWTSAGPGGVLFALGVYADIGGSGASASIELSAS